MPSDRHSYVQFYPSDWIAGTHRLGLIDEAIYFRICCYIWDQAKPCPADEAALIVAEVADGAERLERLVRLGKIERLLDGSFSSARAAAEARRALSLWEKKSRGGKNGAAGKWAQKPNKENDKNQGGLWESHDLGDGSPNGEPEPEPEPEPASSPLTGEQVQIVVDAWHQGSDEFGWPRCAKLTDKRKTGIRQRIKSYSLEGVLKAIKRAGMAAMLTTDPPPKWFTIDFLFRSDDSIAKIMEGKYDQRFDHSKSSWDFGND